MKALLGSLLAILTGVAAEASVSETWIVRTDLWGNPAFSTLTLEREGDRLSGTLDGDKIDGLVRGKNLSLRSVDASGNKTQFSARLDGGHMAGTADFPDTNDAKARARHGFTAWRVPDRPAGAARIYDFAPGDYSNSWSADRAPVLVLWPGDSVRTKVIDSGGVDEKGVTRALFGNPQVGPFFVAGAAPGDTLVVHLRKLTLNRDYADSLDLLVGRALGASLAGQAAGLGKPVRWTLDRTRGLARPAHADGALKDFAVPVRPMLGGLGVAPGFGMPPISTGDTGAFGGNMDFPDVAAGNDVYLPVQQPGALLYMGDAHALQGDGETSQYALETSMDVEFSVDLIKGKAINMPRVESPTQIIALGQAGSLDEALRSATTGLTRWLMQDYGLTLSQVAQLLGVAIKYDVPNLAGRSVGVAARIDKAILPLRIDAPSKKGGASAVLGATEG